MRKSVQKRMFEAISRWQRSGLTQKAWCEKNDFAYSRFHYWYRRYRREEQAEAGGDGDDRFVPLMVEPTATAVAWCELSLADGKWLAFHHPVSVDFLRSLIG